MSHSRNSSSGLRRSGVVTDGNWREWTTYAGPHYLVLAWQAVTIVVPWEYLALARDDVFAIAVAPSNPAGPAVEA